MKQTCGNCVCYLDDTDENGNVTDYLDKFGKESFYYGIRKIK